MARRTGARTLRIYHSMNPIIGREIRSRWRGIKAFGLVLGYAAPLAIAIVLAYMDASPRSSNASSFATRHLGREVFTTLAWVQILGWMLFAPTLTATTIAGEREHGLLEALQLSHLTPWQIVSGKLASALLFVLLMMVASLPVQAICLMMGGVSPLEFITVLALSFSTAIACASVGIACSAWTRRGGIAFRSTFILIIVWAIGSGIAWSTSYPGPSWGEMLWFAVSRAAGITNPVVAVMSIIETMPSVPSAFTTAGAASGFVDFLISLPLWADCMISQVVTVALLLWSAARALRRPLPEQYWIEPRKDSEAGLVPKGKSRSRQTRRPGGPWWEIPILSQLHFSNPVMMREARGKFRLRQVPMWVLVFEGLLAIGVFSFYCYLVYLAITDPSSREGIWWGLAAIGFFVVMIAAPMMGAAAFTRERESGTWQGLMLSLLDSRKIVSGKLGAALLTCLLFSVPLWPLLALCVRPGGTSNEGITITQALLTIAVIASTTWFYTLTAMLLSWYCKRTPISAGWTIGALFAANIFFPMIWSIIAGSAAEAIMVHPWAAMGAIDSLSHGGYYNETAIVWNTVIAHTALGVFIFWRLEHLMDGRDREPDKSNPNRAYPNRV